MTMNAELGKAWKPDAELDTPYMRAKKEWDDRMGNLVRQAQNWRMACFSVIFAVGLPSVIGMIYLGAQPKEVPHIVQETGDGRFVYMGPVGREWEKFTPSAQNTRAQLEDFLNYTRTASTDALVVRSNWFKAYEYLTPKAGATLSAYAAENDPFKRAADGVRTSIAITNYLPLSPESWQVDWSETDWDKNGNPAQPKKWRAIFKLKQFKPTSQQQMEKNAIGLYIDEFNWSQVAN